MTLRSGGQMSANIRTAVGKAWQIAAFYCLVAAGLYALTNGSAFGAEGVTLAGVVATYVVGATVAGVLVGALRPIAKGAFASAIVGILAAWPFTIGLGILLDQGNMAKLDRSDFVISLIMAVLYGVAGSVIFRKPGPPGAADG